MQHDAAYDGAVDDIISSELRDLEMGTMDLVVTFSRSQEGASLPQG